MIPLRSPVDQKKFPRLLLIMCSVLLLWEVIRPLSIHFFPGRVHALILLWYAWIFTPVAVSRKPGNRFFSAGVVVLVAGTLIYLGGKKLLPTEFWGIGIVSLIMGFTMRDQIWDTVETLVFGPRLFSVYEVPCYVHVFFYFFYLFVGQLFVGESGGNMLYLSALIAFITGFLLRTSECLSLKARPNSL